MSETGGEVPDSALPYDAWMEAALRGVVLDAIEHVAANGLPDGHHFYITFRTDFPGVSVPARVLAKYPHEITIVLQHQYDNLRVDRDIRAFGVTLYFGGVPTPMLVPVAAVSAFSDPHVQYGLRFSVAEPEPAPEPATVPAETAVSAADESEAPQVVRLDAFRKRRD